MGNDVAKNCANRMAIGAMSNVTDLERPVIQRMSEKLSDIAKREGSKDLVTKEEFAEALNGLEISQSERDILDRIFVMLDRTGEDRINHKEFIVGVCVEIKFQAPHAIDATLSPSLCLLDGVEVHKGLHNSSQDNLTHWLISTQVGVVPFALGKTEELIPLAFELFDSASARITPQDLRFILMTLNTVASYFGDPVMTVAQVDKTVDDACEKLDPPPDKKNELLMADTSAYVADHEFVHEFVEGKGASRYGNKL